MIFAAHASEDFNQRFGSVLKRIAADIESSHSDNLVALLLGGGYGRGEGGVVVRDGIEHPYNDVDFTMVVSNKSAVDWKALNEISHRYEQEIHIDVDFSRPLTLNDIRNLPAWLMWYDLVNGHFVLSGEQTVLTTNVPASLRNPPPVIEATRLLLNRGTGLLWALRILKGVEQSQDNTFVLRNYFKCALALGDALLITHGRFTTPYRGRDGLLKALMDGEQAVAAFDLRELYTEALSFKFSPHLFLGHSIGESEIHRLSQLWIQVLLYVEWLRTARRFKLASDYVDWSGLREPEQHRGGKNLIRNILRNAQMRKLSWKYPRENLYRQLPVLLGLTDRQILDWNSSSERYLTIWKRFN